MSFIRKKSVHYFSKCHSSVKNPSIIFTICHSSVKNPSIIFAICHSSVKNPSIHFNPHSNSTSLSINRKKWAVVVPLLLICHLRQLCLILRLLNMLLDVENIIHEMTSTTVMIWLVTLLFPRPIRLRISRATIHFFFYFFFSDIFVRQKLITYATRWH